MSPILCGILDTNDDIDGGRCLLDEPGIESWEDIDPYHPYMTLNPWYAPIEDEM